MPSLFVVYCFILVTIPHAHKKSHKIQFNHQIGGPALYIDTVSRGLGCEKVSISKYQEFILRRDQGVVSLKPLGGKLAPELVHFVLKKELLNFSEMAPKLHVKY